MVTVLVNFLLIRAVGSFGYSLGAFLNVLLLWICLDGNYKDFP